MSQPLLPTAFAHLEPFAKDWAIGAEAARNEKRLASTMPELRAFYNALLPQVEPMIEYLRPLPLGGMAGPEQRLLNMALTFMEVAPSIEIFFAVDVPNSFAAERFKILPPFAKTAVQS